MSEPIKPVVNIDRVVHEPVDRGLERDEGSGMLGRRALGCRRDVVVQVAVTQVAENDHAHTRKLARYRGFQLRAPAGWRPR